MDFCADGSNNTESHKDVPIGGLGDIDINLQGKIPQKNNVGVNRRFQAKNTQYWNFRIIKTTKPTCRQLVDDKSVTCRQYVANLSLIHK